MPLMMRIRCCERIGAVSLFVFWCPSSYVIFGLSALAEEYHVRGQDCGKEMGRERDISASVAVLLSEIICQHSCLCSA
jgi:hypothetical protein